MLDQANAMLSSIRNEYINEEVKIELSYRDEDSGGIAAQLDSGALKQGNFKIVVYRACTSFGLDIVLRHELMHIRDILNPDFKFDLEYLYSGDTKEKIKEIAMVQGIWDLCIDLRLEQANFKGVYSVDERIRDFNNTHNKSIQKASVLNLLTSNRFCLDEIKRVCNRLAN